MHGIWQAISICYASHSSRPMVRRWSRCASMLVMDNRIPCIRCQDTRRWPAGYKGRTSEMRRSIWWTSLGLRLLLAGIVMLGVGFDWHWCIGSMAWKTREALSRPGVLEGNLDGDSTWPSLIRAEQVHLAVFDWSWIKGA